MRHPETLHRAELELGSEALDRLAAARVILLGVGGVGSWCAEALVRTGIGHLTLVDPDRICPSNVNRQLQTTAGNVGEVKVEAMRQRLLEIRPDARVEAMQKAWDKDTRESFDLGRYDYVIDAIDSLNNKVELLRAAHGSGATVFSAMGAASKLDPTRIRVASIWQSEKCRLARLVRKRLRRRGFDGDFVCVYSDEKAQDVEREPDAGDLADGPAGPDEGGSIGSTKARVNGSVVHMTATFGMVLAGLVVQDIAKGVETD